MTAFDPEKITFFAKTDARGQDVTFGIKAKDRQRHMYVVGKTGMGKSTLLENMAAQDIQNGEGMAFIDPHGSAAETLLDYVPEHRLKDVIYFAPFDTDHPVSFNVMEDVGPDKRHLVVSGLMSTFKKIWVDAWSARMEYILTNALLVLIEYPDTTLLSVNRLFIDKNFRNQVVDACTDPAVKSFWTEEFANYTERFAAEALPSIQNKIGQFTGNPLIRNIIGQPHSSFDIRQIMDEKKILIMNLSKGLIGETNANLLGSMLTTRIYLAAMSRADLPVEQMRQMPNFYFYVDEFQSFANATFANILSEARKYHLNLIIAHQYIAQMEEEVRDAVFGNVGTTVAFRVGPFDAEVLETVFTPRFLAADMVNLGFAQIYLTLMIDGIGSQPFSAVTLPPVQRPPVSCKQMVIESSRQMYAKDRPAVEQVVADLHTPKAPESKPRTDANSNGNGKPYENKSSNGNSRNGASVRPLQPANVNGESNNNNNNRPTTDPRNAAINHRPVTPNVAKDNQAFDNRPPRKTPPAKPAKTPDDLRAILAKMTQSNNVGAPAKNSVSVSTDPSHPKSTDSKQSVSKSGLKTASDAEKPFPRTDSGSSAKSPENLKSALADILKKAGAVTPQQTSISTPQAVPSPQSQQKTPLPTQVPATQAQSTQKPENKLNPAEIKRMLRQSDQERSPFA